MTTSPTSSSTPTRSKCSAPRDLDQEREHLRHRSRESLYFFAKVVLGYKDLTPTFHRELCNWLQYDNFRGGRYLIEVFRGGLKTCIVTVAWTLWELIQYRVRTDGVVAPLPEHFGPLSRFVICGGSHANISKILTNRIQTFFYLNERTKLFHWLFPEIVPMNFREFDWNATTMTIPRPYNPDGPTIDTVGVGSKVEGKRANRIVEDDLFTREDAESEVKTASVINYHQLMEPILEVINRDELATVGNRWAFQDLNGYIRENEAITRHFARAVYSCPCHQMGIPCDNAVPTWPERFSEEVIQRLRAKLTPYQFSCQYLNAPNDPENKPFRVENLRYYVWEGEPGLDGYLRIEGSNERISPRELYRVGACDPARTVHRRGDRSALIGTGVDDKHRIFLLDSVSRRVEPVQLCNDMLDFYKRWEFVEFGLETVAYQYMLKNFLETWLCGYRNIWLPLRELKSSNSQSAKDARITHVVGQRTGAGQVYVNRNQNNFIQEFMWYPDKTYPRDLLDAFAYCSQMWHFADVDQEQGYMGYEAAQLRERDKSLGVAGY